MMVLPTPLCSALVLGFSSTVPPLRAGSYDARQRAAVVVASDATRDAAQIARRPSEWPSGTQWAPPPLEPTSNDDSPRIGAVDLAPPALASLKVGGPSLALPRGRGVATRVASRPHAFLLRGFLSHAECESLINSATAAGMRSASSLGGTIHRSGLDFTWLGSDSPLVDQLTSDVSALLLADGAARQSKDSSGGGGSGRGGSGGGGSCGSSGSVGISSEPLNVLRYAAGGEFRCHYDNPIQMGLEPGARVLTVLYFLNGVGATWFPLARTQPAAAAAGGGAGDNQPPLLGPKDAEKLDELLQGRSPEEKVGVTVCSDGQLPQTSSQCDGLKVAGEAGDALAFFHLDGSGCLDLHAMHSGLPAPRTRWMASHFFIC